jgi:hypothetical protein
VKTILARVALSVGLVAGLGMLATTTSADHDYSNECHNRLESARARLDHDVARHGADSPQVARDRDRIEAVRQWCRDHKADWDHTRFDVGVYIK